MLRKKMWRDIVHNKIQFFSIFIMVFLGTFIYAGIGGEWYGLKQTSDNYYSAANAADIWLYGNDFSENTEKDIEAIKGVTGSEKRLVLSGTASLSGTPEIEMNFVTENKISSAYTMSGSQFNSSGNGVWVDEAFADANHLKVGDKLTMQTSGQKLTLKIAGLILAPDYVYFSNGSDFVPNHKNSGFVFIPYKKVPAVFSGMYSQILLTTKSDDYTEVVKKLEKQTAVSYSALITRKDNSSYQTFSEEIQQHQTMGSVFPMAFLLIAVLTVITTMTRLIAQQRTLIGTLKALGFKKNKILFHYVSYGFVLSLAGALAGSLFGPLILPKLFYPIMSATYLLPQWRTAWSGRLLFLPLLLVCCCTWIAYLVTRKYLREKPAESMRPPKIKENKQDRKPRKKSKTKIGFAAR